MPRSFRWLFRILAVALVLAWAGVFASVLRASKKSDHRLPVFPSAFGFHIGEGYRPEWPKPPSALPWLLLAIPAAFVLLRTARASVLDHYQAEFRAHLLRSLALAARRGQSLAPCLLAVRDDFDGPRARVAERVLRGLDSGMPLSEALFRAGGREFPWHLVDSVRAAEGTGRVADALEAAAADAREEPSTRSRVRLALLYPCLLLAAGGVVGFLLPESPRGEYWYRTSFPERHEASLHAGAVASRVSLGVLAFVLALLVAIRLFRAGRPRRLVRPLLDPVLLLLPGIGGAVRLGASSRLLRSMAGLVRAGVPLDQVLERAGPAAGNSRVEASAEWAAASIRAGTFPPDALAALALPRFARTRLAAAAGGTPERFGAALEGLARECAERRRERERALTASIYPAAVLVCGAIAALQYAALFMYEEGAREAARAVYLPW